MGKGKNWGFLVKFGIYKNIELGYAISHIIIGGDLCYPPTFKITGDVGNIMAPCYALCSLVVLVFCSVLLVVWSSSFLDCSCISC